MKTTLPQRVANQLTTAFHRDPFGSLRDDFNAILGRFAGELNGGDGFVELPSMDLAETDKQVEVKMDVPGMKPGDVNVEVHGDTLVISGQHQEEKEEKGKTFHRVERRTGSIRRSITLPCEVQEDKIAAECRDGVLTVTLPKLNGEKSRKIPVKG